MKQVIKLVLVVAALLLPFAVSAQNDEVTLVTSGCGATKEEATQSALRSAIEQAFGTFVSSDTQILNDELVKDEIITVSSGNIKNYNEISDVIDANQLHTVTVQSTVSVNKLVSYAKAHGSSAELAGATFMMNMKMQQLNKENERKAFDNLCKQLRIIAQTNLFDYKLTLADMPVQNGDNNYRIYFRIDLYTNQNFINFFSLAYNTLNALSLKEEERKLYDSVNIPYYNYGGGERSKYLDYGESIRKRKNDKEEMVDRVCFYFRNDLPISFIFKLMYWTINNFSLYDDKSGLLNSYIFSEDEIYHDYSRNLRSDLRPLLKEGQEYQRHLSNYHQVNDNVNEDDVLEKELYSLFKRKKMGLQFYKTNFVDNNADFQHVVEIPTYFDSLYGYIDISGSRLSSVSNISVEVRDVKDVRIDDINIDNEYQMYFN